MMMMMHALDERGINVALKLFQMTDLSLYLTVVVKPSDLLS